MYRYFHNKIDRHLERTSRNFIIIKAAMTTSGGASPSGLDATAWRHLLIGYRPFQQLTEAIASLARRLCTQIVDPKSVAAYTSSRLIPLDKNIGVRLIGIGEVV